MLEEGKALLEVVNEGELIFLFLGVCADVQKIAILDAVPEVSEVVIVLFASQQGVSRLERLRE